MFFDTHFWLTAIICGSIAAVLALIFSTEWKKWTVIISGVVTLILVRIIMYYFQPSFSGSFFGAFELILATLVPPCVFTLTLGTGYSPGKVLFRVYGLAFAVLFTVPTVTYIANAWGSDNAQRFVKQAKIRIASVDDKMPPTDPQHMVLVTASIAAFRGQSALTSSDANLSSKYKTGSDNYVLQCVKGHRYWIAPLEYTNTSDQLNFSSPESPGYVVVDAEDPEAPASVKLGYHITVFADGDFGQNLERFLYQSGYTRGYFLDPKFEVDDNWSPHWVVSYALRPFGNIAGKQISKVLVVDVSQNQPRIDAYDLDKQPRWIDRVMPQDLLKEYVENWGQYGGKYAREHFWSVWFGWRKDGTTQAADWDLNYTTDEQSVWVIPMTSRNSTDHGATGVLVYETSKDSAVYYPGLRGFNAGSSVSETMTHARDNIKGYQVESVQLYSIYGQLTWVAIYTSPQSIGSSFAGVGLMHANSQNSADVIFAPDLSTALSRYSSQLATREGASTNISRTARAGKEKSGRIARIAYLPNNQTTPTYVFTLDGDTSAYVVTRDTYKLIPLVAKGDSVVIRFIEVPGADMAVSEFACKQLK
ncbi:MAG: hypothetical protein JSS86_16460 [Cyanobacteria bacterium SZAS LIN-2]|nr:hypothetical protein [Cyanobacteria bacterium SZAS LIN-3]MBS1997918.1 hypothetical protein [Cyanobacteria bacterium SZAS LIN-2]